MVLSNLEDAENYNMFYGNYEETTIKVVLNEEPSLVKIFKTLNYEGSQPYINHPIDKNSITVDNYDAWIESSNILGWLALDIQTNLDTGSVIEFIRKEGKWFNYIKGSLQDLQGHPCGSEALIHKGKIGAAACEIDVTLFGVQGLGVSDNITII